MLGNPWKCSSTGSDMADKELMSEDMTSGGAGADKECVAFDLVDGERLLAELDGGRRDARDVGCRNGAVAAAMVSRSISTRALLARPYRSDICGKPIAMHAIGEEVFDITSIRCAGRDRVSFRQHY